MTSNIGSSVILENTMNSLFSASDFEKTKEEVMNIMKSTFKPEFLNRIDDIVFFKGLTLPDLSKIVDIQLNHLKERLEEKDIELYVSDEAKEFIATRGYDPADGARPLKRTIMQYIENPMVKKILANNAISKIEIDVHDDELDIKTVS